MLSRRVFAGSFLVLLPCLFVSVRPRPVCTGFLPPNDLRIPIGIKEAKGITRAQFNEVLDRIEAVYGPDIAARGGTLKINRLWENPTVNASAERDGDVYILNMYGGLARHEAITQDGFALVACHETGHHIGGAPKIEYHWASNEGQSDYFANLKCLRRIFSDPGSAHFTRMAQPDPVAQQACAKIYKDAKEQAICLRAATAGLSVTALFRALHHEPKEPRFDTPDPAVVETMYDDHPATQCRLDTYFQGSLCAKPVAEAVDDADPAPGTCTRSQAFAVGLRPLCWYKPPASEPKDPLGRVAVAPRVREALSQGAAFSELRNTALWRGR